MVDKEAVVKALKEVYDPEIPVSVYDLGLIYEIKAEGESVHVKMTLTAPHCPMAQMIVSSVEDKLKELNGAKEVKVELVFDPPWAPEKMSEEAKKKLGFG